MPTTVRPCEPDEKEKKFPFGTPQRPDPFTLVLFGATGDLAGRKLMPAFANLWRNGFLPESCAFIGVGRRETTDDSFRNTVRSAIETQTKQPVDQCVNDFLSHVYFCRSDVTTGSLADLGSRVGQIEQQLRLPGNRLFYLATDPKLFAPIVKELARTGLVRRDQEQPWSRLVIEKPFGHDLNSAVALDRDLLQDLRPDQIYRIDHYLGKETVQNLLAFRFGNAIFEPLFNRQHVDHVQITVAETVGMEGKRGAYYDTAGALRDVVQNHMLQLLALTAMDPPATLRSGDISDAKLTVLNSLVPPCAADVPGCVVRGQYRSGAIDGKTVHSYHDEDGVDRSSKTETFVALRTSVENWRWAGVPFLLRTGKRMHRRVTEIAIQFKLPPLQLFRTLECVGDVCDLTDAHPSILAFRIQPDEGISLSFSAKRPGMNLNLHPVRFAFDFDHTFSLTLPEAYERLILDALRGDATLFTRSDEVESAWRFVTPILDAWKNSPLPTLTTYEAGSWGPGEADRLLEGLSGGWRKP